MMMKKEIGLNVMKWLVTGSCLFSGAMAFGNAPASEPFILDMVHHNPGEAMWESRYNDPAEIQKMGYNGKVYFLFDSPLLAIDWDPVDPDILPDGSKDEAWVKEKAERCHREYARCVEAGVKVYAMTDLILFPKRLVEKYGMKEIFGDPRDPQTEKFLRTEMGLIFDQFPEMDGLVVRIGETYLQDAPFHTGKIKNKKDAEKTIIPLMQILRDELCVKRNKELIFRTWMAFDKDYATYMKVNDAVEPHENLTISIKHCEGDFHRGNGFSRLLGVGRHPQIVEVQCAREYEGKGAYPNYVLHGVVEGFEEHQPGKRPSEGPCRSIREFSETPVYSGVWTWTRGGGWYGPFITNELWCDLNAWVSAQWAKDTTRSEEEVFYDYCRIRLNMAKEDQMKKLRKLCLLSADAVIRGRRSTDSSITPWWTRDHFIGVPPLPKNKNDWTLFLEEKDQSVAMWEEMVRLADEISLPDETQQSFMRVSARYGLYVYSIYRAGFNLAVLDPATQGEEIAQWIAEYDQAWADYRQLKETLADCSSLYKDTGFTLGNSEGMPGLGDWVDALRLKVKTSAQNGK